MAARPRNQSFWRAHASRGGNQPSAEPLEILFLSRVVNCGPTERGTSVAGADIVSRAPGIRARKLPEDFSGAPRCGTGLTFAR